MKILITLIVSILGAILYRMGGAKGFDTKFRDLGVPTIATGLMVWFTLKSLNLGLVVAFIVAFGLLFGALTTYFKKKGSPARWWNWLLVGLVFSLSALPIAIATKDWLGFTIRSVILIAGVTLWSELIKNAVLEELGRGLLIIITLPLLFLRKKK